MWARYGPARHPRSKLGSQVHQRSWPRHRAVATLGLLHCFGALVAASQELAAGRGCRFNGLDSDSARCWRTSTCWDG